MHIRRIGLSENDELLKQIRHEIWNGTVGSNDFEPLYTLIVTWKNVKIENDSTLNRTNTYQLILATDEIRTYAIFNYFDVIWDDLTDANGSYKFSTFVSMLGNFD